MASQSYHINTDYYCRHSIVVAVGRITDSFLHHSQHTAVGSNELGHAHHSRTDCSGHHNIFIDLIADIIMRLGLNCYLLAHHHPLLRAKTFRRSWARRAMAMAIITVVIQQTSTRPCPNRRLPIDHLVRSLSRGPHRSFSLWDDDFYSLWRLVRPQ